LIVVDLPKVFIILLNWNGAADTLECVRSLRALTYPNYEVVIVDNGSSGDDVAVLKEEAPECYIIENGRNDGFSEGNNVGMRYALARGADYLLLLNNDTVVESGFLDPLVEAVQADTRIGIVAPRVCPYDAAEHAWYPRAVHRWPVLLNFHVGTLGLFQRTPLPPSLRTVDVRFADGCCFLVKREVLERVGLFDPVYFFGGYESLCLSRRVLQCGYRIVAVLGAVIWAKVARSVGGGRGGALAYAYWSPRSRVIFARKHLTWLHYFLFLLELPLHMAVWAFGWGRQAPLAEKVRANFRGLWDGLTADAGGTLARIRNETLRPPMPEASP
jgi:GT2 family glycosyltransferase